MKVVVYAKGEIHGNRQSPPVYDIDVRFRGTLIDRLQPFTDDQVVIQGEFVINSSFSVDILQPTTLRRIQLNHATHLAAPGLKVKLRSDPALLRSLAPEKQVRRSCR